MSLQVNKQSAFIQFFIIFSLGIGLLFFSTARTSASGGAGQSLGTFLEESSSTVHLGMGKTGQSDDVGQIWYNAAALYDHVNGRNLSVSYVSSVDTLGIAFLQNHLFFGYAWPSEDKRNKFALATAFLSNNSIEGYDTFGTSTGTFSTIETVSAFAHYWLFLPNLYFSETVKFFFLNYDRAAKPAISVDVGLLYKVAPFLDLEFTLDNIFSSSFTFAIEEESLPMQAQLRPVFNFLNKRGKLFVEAGYILPAYTTAEQSFSYKVGLQFNIWQEYLIARMGWDGTSYQMGISTKIEQYKVNFAFLPGVADTKWSVGMTVNLDSTGAGPFARPKTVASSDLEEELVDFHEGLEKYNVGEYKSAYDKFMKVLELNPEHELALLYKKRSFLHLKTSNWLDEEQQRLIKLHKDLAQKYEIQNNFGEAIAEWRNVLQLNPADDEAPTNIERIKKNVQDRVIGFHKAGLDAYAVSDKLKAIDGFSAALRMNPEYEPSKTWLLKIKQELSKEELQYREKIERQQKAEVFFTRGLNFYSQAAYQEAMENFTEAYRLNNEHPRAQNMIEEARIRLKMQQEGGLGREASEKIFLAGMRFYDNLEYFNAIQEFNKALIAFAANDRAREMIPVAEKKLKDQIKPVIDEGITFYNKKRFSVAKERFFGVKKLDLNNEEADKYLNRIDNEMDAGILFNFREGKKAFMAAQYTAAIDYLYEVVKLETERKGSNPEAEKMLKDAQQKVANDISAFITEGTRAFDEKRYVDSIEKFEKVLAIDPANQLALRYITEANKLRQSTQNLKRAETFYTRSKELLQNRDFTNALRDINSALEIDPKNKDYLAFKERCLREIKAEQDQEKISNLFIEGVRFYKFKKYDDAIGKWNEIKKIDFNNALVARYIKQAEEAKKNYKIIDFVNCQEYFKKANYVSARTSCQQAIAINPANADARKLLDDINERINEEKEQWMSQGNTAFRKGEYQEAARHFTEASRLSKDVEIIEKRNHSLEAFEKLQLADKYFSSEENIGLCFEPYMRVLELNPLDTTVNNKIKEAKERGKKQINRWLDLAQNAIKNNDHKKAYSYYVSITQIEPENLEVKKNIILTRNKLSEIAEKPYKELIEAMAIKNYSLAIKSANDVVVILDPYKDTRELLKKATALRNEEISSANTGGGGGGGSDANLEEYNNIINQGIVLYRQAKYDQAIATWNRVPKSSSAYVKAQKYVARAQLKK